MSGIGIGVGVGVSESLRSPLNPLLVSGKTPFWLYRLDELAAVPDGTFTPWTAAAGPDLVSFVGGLTDPSIGTDADGFRGVHCDGTIQEMNTAAAEGTLQWVYDGTPWEMVWVEYQDEQAGAARPSWGTGAWAGGDPGIVCYHYGSGGGADRGKMKIDIDSGSGTVNLLDFALEYPIGHVFQYRFDPGGSPKGRFYVDTVLMATFNGAFTPSTTAGDALGFVMGSAPNILTDPASRGEGFQRVHGAYPLLSDADSFRLGRWAMSYLESGP